MTVTHENASEDASPSLNGNTNDNTFEDASPTLNGNTNDDTHPCRSDPIIDPVLYDTPDLNSSVQTQTQPDPVIDPILYDTPDLNCSVQTQTRPDPVIDPMLYDTPDLNCSVQTQTPSPVPRTPDAPRPSIRHHSSPLSDIPDRLNTRTSEQMAGVKRKRQAPKGKGTSKVKPVKRKTVQV